MPEPDATGVLLVRHYRMEKMSYTKHRAPSWLEFTQLKSKNFEIIWRIALIWSLEGSLRS